MAQILKLITVEISDWENYIGIRSKYLLSEFVPKVIETEAEYDHALAVAEKLTFQKNRTAEEKALHKLLVTLIEVYE